MLCESEIDLLVLLVFKAFVSARTVSTSLSLASFQVAAASGTGLTYTSLSLASFQAAQAKGLADDAS